MCAAHEQHEGGKPSPGHYGRSMLSYSSTTEPNEYTFSTAHFAALLVPMSASREARLPEHYPSRAALDPSIRSQTVRKKTVSKGSQKSEQNRSWPALAAELPGPRRDCCVLVVLPHRCNKKRATRFAPQLSKNRSLSKQKLLHSSRRSAYTALNRS